LNKNKWVESGRCIWFLQGNFTKEAALEIAEKGRALIFDLKNG
jgi:hypothetical protein